jgi:hypothetical protein
MLLEGTLMADIYTFTTNDSMVHSIHSIDFDELRAAFNDSRRIQVIKEVRRVTGFGLKESKDLVEKYMAVGDADALVDRIKDIAKICPDPYTKEEFMALIERAIDTMDTYHFTDMLSAVDALLTNVKLKGGLEALAKERDKFLNAI